MWRNMREMGRRIRK